MLIELDQQMPVFTPEARTIKEFYAIIKRDKSKDKELALAELAFVYFITDYKSPFMNISESSRDTEIISSLKMPNGWKKDKIIDDAINKYIQIRDTKSVKLLKASYSAIDKLIDHFNSVDLTKKDNYGKPIYNAKDLMANLKSVGDVVNSLKKLEQQVKKDEEADVEMRGGGRKGLREDPKI